MENQNMIFALAGIVKAKLSDDPVKVREYEKTLYGAEIPLKITINGELRLYE
jgi:hypothetical protein